MQHAAQAAFLMLNHTLLSVSNIATHATSKADRAIADRAKARLMQRSFVMIVADATRGIASPAFLLHSNDRASKHPTAPALGLNTPDPDLVPLMGPPALVLCTYTRHVTQTLLARLTKTRPGPPAGPRKSPSRQRSMPPWRRLETRACSQPP